MATQQAWQTLERVRASHDESETNRNEHGGGETLAQALGWFSIGLGAAQVLAPRTFSRAIGLQSHPLGTTLFGLREIASGIGILRTQKPSEWLMARVAGNVLDLAVLGSALPSSRAAKNRVLLAAAAVAGVTVLDILATQKLSHRKTLSHQPAKRGMRVQRTMTINCSPEEAYRFWRNFENLPRFMHYLESVTTSAEGTKSHWVAKAPAGTTVAWDAELVEDRPDELIRWRSLAGSQVETTGSVEFRAAPEARGTEVHVDMTYNPPGGRWGATLASLFGRSGEQEVREDLRRFKRFLETGEVPTTKGQPHGKCLL